MKKVFSTLTVIAVIYTSGLFLSCSKSGYHNSPQPSAVNAVIKSAAGDSAGIVSRLNEFRSLAGETLNTAPGVTGGRREINWDAVPAGFTNANNFPFDFFGASDPALPNARKRGLVLISAGAGFRVDSTHFSEIDNSYTGQFGIFSQKRLFASAVSNITEISFKVPGTTADAFVKGFAVIFCDVDDANSTSLEYFSGTKSLGVYKAAPAAQGFSLLGVTFPDEKVTKVKITAGNAFPAAGVKDISNAGAKDIVVMDDFIYDEPKPFN